MGFISASRRILFENENIMRGFNGKAPLELPEELMTKEEKESFKKTGKSRSFSVMNGLNQFYWDKEEKETPVEKKEEKETPVEVKTEEKEVTETPVEVNNEEHGEEVKDKRAEREVLAKYRTLKNLLGKIRKMEKIDIGVSKNPMIKGYNNLSSNEKKKAIEDYLKKFIMDSGARYKVYDIMELSSSIRKISNQTCKKNYIDFIKYFIVELQLFTDNDIAKDIVQDIKIELDMYNAYNKMAFFELFKSIDLNKVHINDQNIDSIITNLQTTIDSLNNNIDAKKVFGYLTKNIDLYSNTTEEVVDADTTFESENGVIMMTNEEIDSIAEDMEEVLHGIKESALEEDQ